MKKKSNVVVKRDIAIQLAIKREISLTTKRVEMKTRYSRKIKHKSKLYV